MSSYNIAGLISEVSEEVATQIAKYCHRQPPHSHLRRPPTGTPASIRIYLIFPETRVIGLHFCRCMCGSIFIQICAVGSKRCIFYAPECVLAVQSRSGSSKVDDFGTNRKHVYDFLLVINSNCMIVAWVVLTQCQRVTDGRSDGQMDGRIYYS